MPIGGNSGLLKAGEVTNLLYSTIYNSKIKSRAEKSGEGRGLEFSSQRSRSNKKSNNRASAASITSGGEQRSGCSSLTRKKGGGSSSRRAQAGSAALKQVKGKKMLKMEQIIDASKIRRAD